MFASTSVLLQKDGRIIIPKHLREALGLGPKVKVSLESTDGRITLKKLDRASTAKRK